MSVITLNTPIMSIILNKAYKSKAHDNPNIPNTPNFPNISDISNPISLML